MREREKERERERETYKHLHKLTLEVGLRGSREKQSKNGVKRRK